MKFANLPYLARVGRLGKLGKHTGVSPRMSPAAKRQLHLALLQVVGVGT